MISISEDIQLQDVKIEDQETLISLLSRIYPPAYKHLWIDDDCSFYLNKFYSIKNLELELSEADAKYYFVFYQAKLAGILRFVYNSVFEAIPQKKSTYLNRIYLGEEAQGQGVAHQLFNWMENKVKEQGNTLIWLKAMDSQQQALRFYEKEGYLNGKQTQLNFDLLRPELRGMKILYKHLY